MPDSERPPIPIGRAGRPTMLVRLGSWAEVAAASAEGLLDEQTFVELKKALPPAGKNVETARDLASFGVQGGVLVVGIEDAGGGKAGDVVGVDDVGAVRDRLVAIADGAVQPPLPCDVFVVSQPDQPTRGCVVCVIPPSSQAPHRADDRYWGRSSTGKRVLADPEVAALFASRRNVNDSFRDELLALADDFDPIPPDQRRSGHVYLAAKPKQPPLETLAWSPTEHLLSVIVDALQPSSSGWPDFRRITYAVSHPTGLLAQSFPAGGLPDDETDLAKLLIRDDGTLHAVSGLSTFERTMRDGSAVKAMMLAATAAQVDQFVRAAGIVAHRQGIWGSWTVGVRITNLLNARSHRETYGFQIGSTRVRYPEAEYMMITDATSGELRDNPQRVVERLLSSLARGFAETHLFPYAYLNDLFRS